MWVLRLWLEQNLEVIVPLLISEEKDIITPDLTDINKYQVYVHVCTCFNERCTYYISQCMKKIVQKKRGLDTCMR